MVLSFALGWLLHLPSISSAAPLTNVVFSLGPNNFPALTANAVTNGQIQFSLDCQSGIRCVIESSPDLANWTPMITNSDFISTRLISLPVSGDTCFYRAARDPIPLFVYALASQTYIEMPGNGIITDSWNSHDTNKSSNGYYSGYRGTNGSVASENGVVDFGNHTINGNLYLGDNTIFIGGNVAGTIYSNINFSYPDISLPTADTNGNPIVWQPAPGNSSAHSFTTSGYYTITDSGSITVSSGITVILDVKATSYSPTGVTINGGTTNAGTIIIYQESGRVTMNRTGGGGAYNNPPTVPSNRPENFVYLGLPGVTNITFALDSFDFVGAVYAPEADAIFNGGGQSYNFMGSCIANSFTVNSRNIFHFDESLLAFGPFY
jgi:hypothetical protein